MGTGIYYSRIDDTVNAFAEIDGDLVAVGVFPAIPASPVTDNWARWTCGVTPNSAPTAVFSNGPLTGQVNRTATIYGTSSTDLDGHGLEFYWQFGDGTSSHGLPRAVGHAYAAPGTYQVTLVVHDGELASPPVTTTVTITGFNQPPSVSLTSPSAGTTFTAPAVVQLAASASDFDGTIQRVEFYEGSTLLATDTSVPYTFTWSGVAAGRYTVRAVAYDNGGASASATATVIVGAAVGASADAYVRDGASASVNFGAAETLDVRTSTAGDTRWSYLRFDTSALSNASSARLRIYGALSAKTSAQVRVGAFAVPSIDWVESAITWNGKPALRTSALATATMVNSTTARWYELDLTQYVKQEKAVGRHVISIAFKSTTTNTVQSVFRSREAAANAPVLVITP